MIEGVRGGGRAPIYRPHHHLLFELNPGYVSADGLTHHDAYGFRGGEFARPKPEGLFRVVCMGESTTYCTGIARDDETYPARLEAHLRQARPDLAIEVLNAGVGGYTSAENLLHYIFKVQPVEADLIVFYYTHNDVHPRRFPTLSRDYREYSRSWYEPLRLEGWFRRWRYRLLQLLRPRSFSIGDQVRRYLEHPSRPAENIHRNPPVAFELNMRMLITLVRSQGTRLLLVNPPYVELDRPVVRKEEVHPVAWAVHEHRTIIERLGAELSCPVYDLKQEMPYEGGGSPWKGPLHWDKAHVNEKDAEVQGRLIARQIVDRGLLPSPRVTMPAAGGVTRSRD